MADPSTLSPDIDYVFGTNDEELQRLGLQHRVWRPRASDAWRRAGFTLGQTILDVGSGPGFASIDLAEIAGSEGRVVALERSSRFIAALEEAALVRGLNNITTHAVDFDIDLLPGITADGAWVRWVFAFLKQPKRLVEQIAASLNPGGALVIHEYFDYRSWRFTNRVPMQHEYVEAVIRAWHNEGGEPDIALDLLEWIERAGLRIESTRTIVDVITPKDFAWNWPKSFIDIGSRRLASIGELSDAQAKAIREEFAEQEKNPHARMITPAVLEIIARK